MKCIHCNSDTRYPDRVKNGGRCEACKHPFAFEPKPDPLTVTDGLFQRVLADVSGDDGLFFTEKQLWYAFCRRLIRRRFWRAPFGWAAGGSALTGVVTAFALTSPVGFVFGVLGVAASAGANAFVNKRKPRAAPPPLALAQFRVSYLARWTAVHGAPEKLLPEPSPKDAPDGDVSPELAAYSFDRVLVTESADIAAMLVGNRFHFENNCAILSADGYPFRERAKTILAMLRQNPQLTVFALHDASIEGLLLPSTLRGNAWFLDPATRLVDLGLRPQHAQTTGLVRNESGERRECAPDVRARLTPDETRWLEAGYSAELAAVPPPRLLRAIYQGFARANQMLAEGGDGPGGGIIWVHDAGADAYAADSFG